MKHRKLLTRLRVALLSLFAALAVMAFTFAASAPGDELTVNHPKVKKAIEVQEAVTKDLMGIEDVLGTAVGQDDDGEMSIVVYVNLEGKNPAKTYKSIPSEIAGVRARPEVTEPFRAMLGRPTGVKVSHTAKQTPPIQLGTSGGWSDDIANGYCCSGTLGALVWKGGAQYILSNYHVLEADDKAQKGGSVIQPGLVDIACNANSAQEVATLSGIKSLPSSNVDAAIAPVVAGMVRADGAILEIGTISGQTVEASIGQLVKKSGRTTGLSRSKVSGLNATITVAYSNECAGGTAFEQVFTGQIVISNRGSKFLNAGDSGSLMVEDVTTNPRAVGLLFAGSSTLAIANPIGEVLTFFGATMVGQ